MQAAHLLRAHWPTIRFSSVYRSRAVEKTDQADFLNAVAIVETTEPIEQIVRTLQSVERALGKNVTERFGPRTIDLDLLLYGNSVLPDRQSWLEAKGKKNPADQTLYVPHLKMDERRFVLEPLLECHPAATHPVSGSPLSQALRTVSGQGCERIDLTLQ